MFMAKKLPETADRTQQLYDGVWYKTGGEYYHVCCTPSCCLTHYVEFKLEEGELMMRWTLAPKETKRQLRINKRKAQRKARQEKT